MNDTRLAQYANHIPDLWADFAQATSNKQQATSNKQQAILGRS
jgi:hypothetical protein